MRPAARGGVRRAHRADRSGDSRPCHHAVLRALHRHPGAPPGPRVSPVLVAPAGRMVGREVVVQRSHLRRRPSRGRAGNAGRPLRRSAFGRDRLVAGPGVPRARLWARRCAKPSSTWHSKGWEPKRRTAALSHDNAPSLATSRSVGYAENGEARATRRNKGDRIIKVRMDRATWESRRRDDVEIIGLEGCIDMFIGLM